MTGAGTITELLKRAGVVEVRDGKIVSVSNTSEPLQVSPSETATTSGPKVSVSGSNVHIASSSPKKLNDSVNIRIDININCSVPEMDGLGVRIRKILDEISADPENSSDD